MLDRRSADECKVEDRSPNPTLNRQEIEAKSKMDVLIGNAKGDLEAAQAEGEKKVRVKAPKFLPCGTRGGHLGLRGSARMPSVFVRA